jgi:hypothetical protein
MLFERPGREIFRSLSLALTSYGLDGPGIESRWERDITPASTPAQTATCTMGTGSFPGVKRPGRGVKHPPPSSAEVMEKVELYLYFPSGSSWPLLGRTWLALS